MITPKSDWFIDKLVYFKNFWQKKITKKNDFIREKRFFTREKTIFSQRNTWLRPLHFLFVPGLRRTSTSEVFQSLIAVQRVLFCISEVCSPTTKAIDENKDNGDEFKDGNKSFKDPGRRGRRRPDGP